MKFLFGILLIIIMCLAAYRTMFIDGLVGFTIAYVFLISIAFAAWWILTR